MKDGRRLPVIQPEPDSGVSRRAALQTLAAGLGASLAAPALADANTHPVHRHVADLAGQARRPTGAAARQTAFKPQVFDAHQYATTVLLADLIVPGARAAGTVEFLDKLLAVESADTRRRFMGALGAMDRAAREAHGQPFKDLSNAQQVALLTAASTGEPSRPAVFWKSGDPIPPPAPPPAPATLRDHFDHIKGWVSGIYFASEPGLKELGYTGNMFHERYAGCEHGGQHA